MKKYVTIPDIRQYSSYKSVSARLVYMHACMGMDITTRNYAHSWRQLSSELMIPLQQVRTALKQLEKDGLIATQQVTQQVTYGLTQQVTHKVTQIHIMSISELDEATNEATNSPTNSPTNSQSSADIKNKNIQNTESVLHTHVRGCVPELEKLVEEEFRLPPGEAAQMVDAFLRRQELKGKAWTDEGDLKAHLVSWTEKRTKPKKAARVTDTQAREAEYQRDAEVKAAETPEEKKREELSRLLRWRADWRKKKQDTTELDKRISELQNQ